MANKHVIQHITSYVLESITDKSSNHDELEKSRLNYFKKSEDELPTKKQFFTSSSSSNDEQSSSSII